MLACDQTAYKKTKAFGQNWHNGKASSIPLW